ncbi:glycosyltransferase family 39 protein [Lutimonas saemankumensis]|uniref:ArnT family glycosyltransferase n=1 Tax=Lutimonas saemankumensis TaxID=483016 RepID=UPI001CD411DE|nr:glycosyltransferase family 39 protein [Lutimonas saemankumensis]MCA0932682.1 glycosyltransferase family 39 protein [Lutimonas saemankumensis]
MNNRRYLIFLALACLCIFFPHLGLIEVNIMEARNFITAREMLENGNWIHTTMNLEPRYEKPPLPTWLTALSGAAFGITNHFALRLPAALASVFLVFTFYFFADRLLKKKKQAFIASLILASSFYIVFSGRNGQWDIFAHSFMTFAIFQLYLAFQSETKAWKNWILAGVFLGFSFMSKGPVSLFALLLPFLISYGIVFKYRNFKQKISPLMIFLVVFALVGLSWGLYIYVTDLSTAETIANKEANSWANRSVKPFYHYWSFFVQSGIWTFFSFLALLYPLMIKRVENKKAYLFSLSWTLASVILLSMVPEKKERYLLPVLIPMALTTSFYLNYLIKYAKQLPKLDIYLSRFGFGLIALIGLAAPIGIYIVFNGDFGNHFAYFALVSISLLSLGILILKWLRSENYEYCFYGVIYFICSIILFAFPLVELSYNNDEFKNASTLREIKETRDLEIYSMDPILAPEIIYDLGEPIKRVRFIKDLPEKGSFTFMTYDTIPDSLQTRFNANFVTRFDINNWKKNGGRHEIRNTSNVFVLEKKH